MTNETTFPATHNTPAGKSSAHDKIIIFDTTLRDGEQCPGATMSFEDKLAVAKRSGLNIPSGCTFGLCGTCKIRKTAGEVHMVHNGGISDDDIAEGWILACCSHPMGRVEVEV